MLPDYCQFIALPFHQQDRSPWRPVFGSTVQHIHHYCYGQVAMMRARNRLSLTPAQRTFYWQAAVNEFTYVIERAPIDFVLLPEVAFRRGTSYVALGALRDAMADFQLSIKVYPKYFPAHAAIARLYMKDGKNDLAQRAVEDGLRDSPNAQELLDLKGALDK